MMQVPTADSFSWCGLGHFLWQFFFAQKYKAFFGQGPQKAIGATVFLVAWTVDEWTPPEKRASGLFKWGPVQKKGAKKKATKKGHTIKNASGHLHHKKRPQKNAPVPAP